MAVAYLNSLITKRLLCSARLTVHITVGNGRGLFKFSNHKAPSVTKRNCDCQEEVSSAGQQRTVSPLQSGDPQQINGITFKNVWNFLLRFITLESLTLIAVDTVELNSCSI
jgi:hypothetical protein